MASFIIEPSKKDFARVYDNTFLWKEDNIYVMANHRLALWCWLQANNIFDKKYTLFHIDEHMDNRQWKADGESECLQSILSNFESLKDIKNFESHQCNCRIPSRETRPCITYDNFVSLASYANIFKIIYGYSSVVDRIPEGQENNFCLRETPAEIEKFAEDLKKIDSNIIIDLDLDFFDPRVDLPEDISDDELDTLLVGLLKIISKNREKISLITIAINESPGDHLWDRRQKQLQVIKDILSLSIPIPIMN